MELLPVWVEKVYIYEVIRTLDQIYTKEALMVLAELLPKCDPKKDCEDRIIRSIASNPISESEDMLLELFKSGVLANYSKSRYGLGGIIAERFKHRASIDANFKEQLMLVIESLPGELYEALVCSTLSDLKTSKEISIVFRYLDEETYPNGGQSAAHTLLTQFSRKAPSDYPGSYEVHPQANPELRRKLYDVASKPGASQKRARSILLKLDEMRAGRSGRPSEETRHPSIESEKSWPICLYI